MFIDLCHSGDRSVSMEIILSMLYFLYWLLNMDFGGEERKCGALDILAAILDVCSDHLVAKV